MKKSVVVILALLLPIFLVARPGNKWNNWKDRQSVLNNLEKATKEGRTYFSMQHYFFHHAVIRQLGESFSL